MHCNVLQCSKSADGTDGCRGFRHSWLNSEAALHTTICSQAGNHLGKGWFVFLFYITWEMLCLFVCFSITGENVSPLSSSKSSFIISIFRYGSKS